jgi:hypothetical protein
MEEAEQRRPKEKLPLGLMQLPDNTFEHDLAVSNRYQSFSTELLRLSLLGVAAIGFLVSNVLSKDTPKLNYPPKYLLFISLFCLGLSAACSLLHGYVSADTIARQLRAVRLEVRREENDIQDAQKENTERQKSIRREIGLTIVSSIFLLLGALALASSFIVVL